MYFSKTPSFFKTVASKITWDIPSKEKIIYLTFDDGPHPETTPFILNELKKYDAKASFFCTGNKVEKYTSLYEQILLEKHAVGNHTHTHLNGWKAKPKEYARDVLQCSQQVQSMLFRPPYGKITPLQYALLKKRYRIVMWSVLAGDFDKNTTKEKCFDNIIRNTKEGSIIVLHDSLKTKEKMSYALSKALAYFSEKNFQFEAISLDRKIS